MVPPYSDRISRVPPYSRTKCLSTHTGLSPTSVCLSRLFWFLTFGHWPGPRSLATTNGVSVDVLSSGYLDVSVPQVRLMTLWIQIIIPAVGDGRSVLQWCSGAVLQKILEFEAQWLHLKNLLQHWFLQYCILTGRLRRQVGFPIRISTDQRVLASPRGFSQPITSFIASQCQGIHKMPLCA